jgi:translation initiation factor IF-2
LVKKDLKINIKNAQIAEAVQLSKLREQFSKKASGEEKNIAIPPKAIPTKIKTENEEDITKVEKQELPRRKARAKSVFAEGLEKTGKENELEKVRISEQNSLFEEELSERSVIETGSEAASEIESISSKNQEKIDKESQIARPSLTNEPNLSLESKEALGPTGRHIKDLLPSKPLEKPSKDPVTTTSTPLSEEKEQEKKEKGKKTKQEEGVAQEETAVSKGNKVPKFKEFKDLKPARRQTNERFDARDRHGLSESKEDSPWRKKRQIKITKEIQEEIVVRPTELKVRLPISIKDLAASMKLKSSELIAKLFLQGIVVMINDLLDDETTIVLLGEEFGCTIKIDTSEEQRIRITDKTVKEEIQQTDSILLQSRAPVVTFMGHVDHGKTSLIDYIRKSNRVQAEAGAITQHIGAFLCSTPVGDIAILDTPGHEAFSAMRARGADVTDIVVLVVAGDEGIRTQTEEAIDHAKAAGVTIVVAINKSDKPNFNPENVYRQLADRNLLPETWGGQVITVNCSAVTGTGVKELLEMLALQSEVLELKANPQSRARGIVLESELHKGMGPVATVLVQNGTLCAGDAVVFGEHWGHVKTMQDEYGATLKEAPPSTPVEITGISGLPEAGKEFIVVQSDKEAREIAEARMIGKRQLYLQQTKKVSMESLFQQASEKGKKILRIVLKADVQGSLEALKAALLKIRSDKADIDIISSSIGEVSESDVLLAAASKAMIIGFHTQVESHADSLLKQYGVHVTLHDIIYHVIDDVKGLMTGLLDKVAQETDKGKAEVKATFKSSQLGIIAGCLVIEGTIHRNNQIRVVRAGEIIARGQIASLKRIKDDVREVQKGLECGIVLSSFSDFKEGDILEAYEITYLTQEL